MAGQPRRRLPWLIRLVAPALFELPPFVRVPGWYFGSWNERNLRARARYAIWRLARRRRYEGAVTTRWHFGLRIDHHLASDISVCTYVDGRYEPNEMVSMVEALGPGACMFDVGANAGLFSMVAAIVVGREGQVHAFEPSPREHGRLVQNIAINRLTWVQVHPVALGESSGTSTLHISDDAHPGHNTLGRLVGKDVRRMTDVAVATSTLDEVVDRLALSRLDFIKLDVEGSEVAVVRGGRRSLERFRPVILCEASQSTLGASGSSTDELRALLIDLGYSMEALDNREPTSWICKPVS